MTKALKPVYTAPTESAARARFAEFTEAWGDRYPTIVRLWEQAWAEFVPILAFDAEVRTVVCSTNAIESVNARIRRAVRARGHLPNEAAAPKRVYLAVMSLDPSGQGRRRMDHVLETSPERLRRTPVRRPQVAAKNPSYTVRSFDRPAYPPSPPNVRQSR
ncbi:transposase [Micromonospora chalcea]|uniref:transposase n=1 Tax=Micromonospora chalcea TaxID=1874 RepID=UPI0038305155